MNPLKGGVSLTDDQKISWLRLIRSDNISPATCRDMINYFGSAEQALEMIPELAQRGAVYAGKRAFVQKNQQKKS